MCGRGSISVITISWLLLSVYAFPFLKQRRQVVQPTWLMKPEFLLPVQTEVRVTPQNLQETAALRASIQKAVNEGTYVVATNPEEFLKALGQLSFSGPIGATLPMPLTIPMPLFPAFQMPNATWWTPRSIFG